LFYFCLLGYLFRQSGKSLYVCQHCQQDARGWMFGTRLHAADETAQQVRVSLLSTANGRSDRHLSINY